MNPTTSKLATLLGTASLVTMANAMAAQAQQVAQAQMAQAGPAEVPEQVLITGSLIHGAVAVGVPVTNLSPQDFAQTGALTTADLFRTIPAANVSPGPVAVQSGANIERATKVNLRQLDTGNATRSLLMVDGIRVPGQGNGTCEIDPSIIPALSLDRIDILLDGASATYGSDAVAGVINIILKRGYDGAVSQVRFSTASGGQQRYQASQLWGRTWDGGDITLSYEWYDESPIKGNAHSNLTVDFSPWGLNNRTPLASAMPGIISRGGAGFQVGGSASPNSAAPFANPGLGYGTQGNLGTLCGNCFAIPAGSGVAFNPAVNGGLGPLAPSSAGLPWTTYSGNGGTNAFGNEFNPYSIAWYSAAQQRNGGAITVDQRLTKDITFYGEGFYSNRRAEYLNPANISPDNTNLLSVVVPTFNPYYPTGAGAGALRVNYSLAIEHPSQTSAYEVADRYLGGFHIALPGDWNGDLYYSTTYDSSSNNVQGVVNVSAVSAALGWTIAAVPASGSAPSLGTWTKPASVPYLNLFCDARTIACNSQTTEAYMTGIRKFDEKFWVNEKGAKFDGPLFDLPAGQAKAAVGFTYTTFNWNFRTIDSTQASSLLVPIVNESIVRHVWAGFAQVNVPLVGDNNKFPLFEKLNLEASWRHDQYSDFGGTSNPKVALDWSPIEWFTFKFAWGTNFRAPSVGETSRLANNAIAEQNDPLAVNAPIIINCAPGAGSAFDRLVNPGAGLTGYSVVGCGTGAANPAGISMNGGAGPVIAAGWRNFVNTNAQKLQPEKAMNWAVGGEFAPTTFLKGLDIQATWYSIKLTGLLQSFGNPQSSSLNNSQTGFAYIVPTDLAFLHTAPGDLQCHNNNTPGAAAVGGAPGTGATGCPEFEQMVVGILADPRNTVPVAEQTKILWLNDGGTFNLGYQKMQGIDWTASYDFDLGDLGAWNAGITGTYYLHQYVQSLPGSPVFDSFHSDIDNGTQIMSGVETLPRMRYRARLGWSNGPWSLTGFMDYQSHFFHTQSQPPNVNNQCQSAGSTSPGGTFPCLVTGYTNIEPAWTTFDLSLGYDTGDDPANDYLKHLGIQLVVSNLMDKHSPFEYRIGTGGGNPAAMDILKPNNGRTISLILTKTW
jgi:outer membrane receptor protein involved in Fe transport